VADLTAAVDAGARAWFTRVQAQRRDEGSKRPDGQPWQWEDLTPMDQHAYRAIVLPIVTAAVAAAVAGNTPPAKEPDRG